MVRHHTCTSEIPIGVLEGTCTSVYAWQNPYLKSMGNTVSAHIYVRQTGPLYPLVYPRNDQNWSMVRHLY